MHYPTAAFLWSLRLAMLVYVIHDLLMNHKHLEMMTPGMRLSRPTIALREKVSTWSTGANQTIGRPPVKLDIKKPAYCFPNPKEYIHPEVPSESNYIRGCLALEWGEVSKDQLPLKTWVTTYVEAHSSVKLRCDNRQVPREIPTCNRSHAIVNVQTIQTYDGRFNATYCSCRNSDGCADPPPLLPFRHDCC